MLNILWPGGGQALGQNYVHYYVSGRCGQLDSSGLLIVGLLIEGSYLQESLSQMFQVVKCVQLCLAFICGLLAT